ncbi:hypothetical protein TD95_002394 [Thielaviopsis punctulata]|uniref:tRNA 4-demethylwyosine synthase (AdoMet-dependent) n=1 Tax=Thielaviopsis punctulata TaxID=72032 RepID=A0A0F4ZBL8_9PEZI|nr:hypothetical protein TD95_002394 [Thielaviopsis punctulata]
MDFSINGLARSNPLTMRDLPASGSVFEKQELLELWHEYRSVVIVAAAVVLIAVRVYLHSTDSGHENLVAIPKALDAEKKPLDTEKKAPDTKTLETDINALKTEVSALLASAKSKNRSETETTAVTPNTARPKAKNGPKRIVGGIKNSSSASPKEKNPETAASERKIQPLVFFSSVTTNTERIVGEFTPRLNEAIHSLDATPDITLLDAEVLDLAQIDFDDYFISPPASKAGVELVYLFLLPSYNIDTINDAFLQHLQETHYDFRIDTAALVGLAGYSVFGFGDREGWPDENEGFCFQAKELDKWMAKLTGGKRAYPVGMGDTKVDYQQRLDEWLEGIKDVFGLIVETGGLGEGLPGSGNAEESDIEEVSGDEDEGDDEVYVEAKPKKSKGGDLGDVEDLGKLVTGSETGSNSSSNSGSGSGSSGPAPLAIDFTTYGKPKKTPVQNAAKEMVPVNSPTYKSLTKQGYSIVGSHSGVKICRWTKSALRGRGSCYKFSFYGINSHQCMESTPSLSCSNKCVFCWRHGTNPVGTTWRWVVDPPELIFEGVKKNHYQKIKVLKGMAGVRAERYAEALRIRHCALSLVGEPIFYPHINEFLGMLHNERISSFLVCNAQHPDQLAALKAVTQLYVSIDAADRESLRRIDRPLHRDFWERFQRCLDILREKRNKHRTVFRLTLVKGFNIDDEVDGYADLVERALPCFVEIKGVTYCGTATSANAGLRMQNVPFYWEVCDFVRALDAKLKERGLDYGIAAEHAHSCCILMGSGRFRVNGKWHTQINYQRFFKLVEERGADGDWTPEEYMGDETPEWATWGNGGFDPRDQRVDRKGRPIEGKIEVKREE